MAINVEVSKTINACESFDFPVLMVGVNTGRVILFHSEKSGTVLTGSEKGKPFSTCLPCYDHTTWRKYEGTITISNA